MSKGPWKRKNQEESPPQEEVRLSPREQVYASHDKRMGLAPEPTEESQQQEPEQQPESVPKQEYTQGEVQEEGQQEAQQEAPAEEQPREQPQKVLMDVSSEMAEWAKSKGFDPEEIKASKSLFNSVKSQMEAEKTMSQERQRAGDLEKAFSELRPFIDWNKVRGNQQGQPQQQTPPEPQDKEKFFADFAERGPLTLDDHILKSPAVQQLVARAIQTVAPMIVQNATFAVKLDDAYTAFGEKYPHLKNFEEDVGKIMLEDIRKNPKKPLMKAMHEAANSMQKLLDGYKEEGKKEAQTIHEERKVQNLPPGDRASVNRVGPITPKGPEEEVPETLSDVVKERRGRQDKTRSSVGYQYQQPRR